MEIGNISLLRLRPDNFFEEFLQVFISRYDPDSSLKNLGSWIRIQPVLLAGIYIYFVWQLFYCEICGVSVKYKKEHINKTHQIDVETYTELIEKRSRGEEIASHLPGSYHAQCCGSKWQIPSWSGNLLKLDSDPSPILELDIRASLHSCIINVEKKSKKIFWFLYGCLKNELSIATVETWFAFLVWKKSRL